MGRPKSTDSKSIPSVKSIVDFGADSVESKKSTASGLVDMTNKASLALAVMIPTDVSSLASFREYRNSLAVSRSMIGRADKLAECKMVDRAVDSLSDSGSESYSRFLLAFQERIASESHKRDVAFYRESDLAFVARVQMISTKGDGRDWTAFRFFGTLDGASRKDPADVPTKIVVLFGAMTAPNSGIVARNVVTYIDAVKIRNAAAKAAARKSDSDLTESTIGAKK